MTIATFNANSIRVRMPIILDWLAEHEPDVLAIQETKCEDDKFPLSDIEDAGYHAAFTGQKSYNGVAILSREPAQQVRFGFDDPMWPDDKRVMCASVGGVRVINTYVPNGNKVGNEKWTYKMGWLERFRGLLAVELQSHANVVWVGDINIAPKPEDVYDSPRLLGGVGHHPDEFTRLDAITALGVQDLFRKFTPGGGHFTYWDFFIPRAVERGLGWRIDHIYANPTMAARATRCEIDLEPRKLERPSDHTFVVVEFA